ncbi:hypothetical protein JQK87_03945 [Streptomyces sp. G44]|uniref:hypothetical protein n=1 Tax=Streptomyces sp. G44 TaxID=2807632 RepID=UPI00195F75B6|nr:hypothetical protein [Streptomyces sp. G44]MBM7167576.1 hypothetical protein [Streptomyces sp. G44]
MVALLGAAQGASPAWAGGIGDFLSPAFGNGCTNHHGVSTNGATTHGTGAANGNFAGLPIGGPTNQCGGADLPTRSLFSNIPYDTAVIKADRAFA